MGKPYQTEMAKLSETFDWAINYDIENLKKAVRASGSCPMLAIGSGGSLTSAHALAGLHRAFTGKMANVATPLEVVAEPLDSQFSAWLLSASGRNVDIIAAFRALVLREPKQLGILCGKFGSSLGILAKSHSYIDLIEFEATAGKDGFLATNSLLAFITLLTRAYLAEFGNREPNLSFLKGIKDLLKNDEITKQWRSQVQPLWARDTTLVLYGTGTRVGAIDLESKFTEAAIGNLQIADYRNFAHGRHHWLAKHGYRSSVLAFTSPDDRQLAEKTLALIPSDIPLAKIDFDGEPEAITISSLIAALKISGWAGQARGIDPGRPGVPDFGRKLYHLPLPKNRRLKKNTKLTDNFVAAIERKSGFSLDKLSSKELEYWKSSLEQFLKTIQTEKFKGLIFDYDGTLVDTRERFSPMRVEVAEKLEKLIKSGITIAIATGRGSSVRKDLQKVLPVELWSSIIIGYYNGAEIGLLSNDKVPSSKDAVCKELSKLKDILCAHPELKEIAEQTNRQYQITLTPKKNIPENRLWDIAHQIILSNDVGDVNISRSSHSVDIVAPGVTKLNVLRDLKKKIGSENSVLKIGDRGRWPGNDFSLLREPHSLSVDEQSVEAHTCWNLAPRGQRGLNATIFYIDSLVSKKESVSLKFKQLSKA